MRFSRMISIYFIVGIIMLGAGVIPYSEVGLVSVWVEDDITLNDSNVVAGDGADSGMLDNLIGPVKNALGTISGGALLAVWGAIDRFMGFWAWPMTVMKYHDAPWEVQLMSTAFVMAFTVSVFRIFRSSI